MCHVSLKRNYQLPKKSSARVLTSSECLQKLLEKEEKLGKQKKKDENKCKREEKRREEDFRKREEDKRREISGGETKEKLEDTDKSNLFTEEEVALFLTRYENGYNIPQKRYIEWLQSQ